MSIRVGLISGVLMSAIALSPALADDPTAMVEDISSFRDDVQLMDYLIPGQEIALGVDETIVIGYFASCLQETITGGTVTVGEYDSEIEGGSIEADRGIECDDQVITYTRAQQEAAGTMPLRNGTPCEELVPDIVVYDTSPLVRLTDDDTAISYTDLCDQDASAQPLEASDGIVDFRVSGTELVVGGLYLIQADGRDVLVLVSKLAEPDTSSLLSRYIPL